ncbi:MAG: hypothetical protein OHK0019_00750 [Saprospiraceae bacterium]
MKVLFFTIMAVFTAFALAPNQPTTTEKTTELHPEDILLKSAQYDQSFFAIYMKGAEAIVEGKAYSIEGDGYLNSLHQTEIVDDETANYIVIDTFGVTRFRFNNISGVCVPAQTEDGKQ